MGYREFTSVEYKALRDQHNIMVLVQLDRKVKLYRRLILERTTAWVLRILMRVRGFCHVCHY